jgi:hypothetical protein
MKYCERSTGMARFRTVRTDGDEDTDEPRKKHSSLRDHRAFDDL